jgi:hypothetical protein
MERTQIQEYVNAHVTSANFLVFAKLLQLRNQATFQTIMDLLAGNMVDLQTINGLPLVNDDEVAKLIERLRFRYDPSPSFDPPLGGFSAYDYLDGQDLSPPRNGLIDLVKESNLVSDRVFGQVFPRYGALPISYGLGASYATEVEVRAAFNQKVLPKFLAWAGVSHVNSSLVGPTAPAHWTGEVAAWITQTVGPFFEWMTDAKLMELVCSINGGPCGIQDNPILMTGIGEIVEAFPSTGARDAFHKTIFNLSSMGHGYTLTEIDALEEELRSFVIPRTDVNGGLTFVAFMTELITIADANLGRTPRTNGLKEAIRGIVSECSRFVAIVNKVTELVRANMTVG